MTSLWRSIGARRWRGELLLSAGAQAVGGSGGGVAVVGRGEGSRGGGGGLEDGDRQMRRGVQL